MTELMLTACIMSVLVQTLESCFVIVYLLDFACCAAASSLIDVASLNVSVLITSCSQIVRLSWSVYV